MSFTAPKAAGAAVLALVASAFVLPLTATPAQAATPVETQFYIADEDGDGGYGLYRRATPTGPRSEVVAESFYNDVAFLTASADGSRFAFVDTTYSSIGAPVRQKLIVRDVSGRQVRVVQDVAWSATHFQTPALSPDGSVIVWTSINQTTHVRALVRANVASGGPTSIATGYGNAVFADPATLIVEDVAGPWYSLPVAGGTRTALPTIPVEGWYPTVSADLSHIAWAKDTTPVDSDIFTGDIYVASLSVTGGVASVSAGTKVATGLNNTSPAFSRDGLNVLYVKDDGDIGNGAIYTSPANGSQTAGTPVATNGDVLEQAIGTTDDGTAPAAVPDVSTAVLKGTQATLDWALPGDADLSGTVLTRSPAFPGTTNARFVPANGHTFTDTGLTLGVTYTYTISSVDRSNHYGTGVTRTLTALAAAPTFADPISRTSTTTTFPVVFGPYRSPSAVFTVDYFGTGDPGWTNWVTDYANRAASFTGVAGKSYTFRVQVKDGLGNSSPLVNSVRAVVPFDQTKATFTGGGNVYTSAAYLGSLRKLWHTTDVARVTLTGNRLQVVGSTCGTCGAFDIYDNGTWVAGVSTYGSVTRLRQVLFTKYYSGIGTHSFSIKPRGTAGHPDVMLDGFAMRT
jgi:hypothetical protein